MSKYLSENGAKKLIDLTKNSLRNIQTSLMGKNLDSAFKLLGRLNQDIGKPSYEKYENFYTYVIPLSTGEVARIKGGASYNYDYAIYSNFDGTTLKDSDLISWGINTSSSSIRNYDVFITAQTECYLAFCTVSSVPAELYQIVGSESLQDSISKFNCLNIFTGKNLSILGDSISTFAGHIGENRVYYPKGDVTNVEQTWWYILNKYLGSTLLQNNSSSGSRVTDTVSSPYVCMLTLAENLSNTDILLINGGTNDSENNVALGTLDFDIPTESLNTKVFSQAYDKLIRIAKTKTTKVFVIIQEILKPQYVEIIKKVCKHHKVTYVDTTTIHDLMTYVETCHPNSNGMKVLAGYIANTLFTEINAIDITYSSSKYNNVEDALEGIAEDLQQIYTGNILYPEAFTTSWLNGRVYNEQGAIDTSSSFRHCVLHGEGMYKFKTSNIQYCVEYAIYNDKDLTQLSSIGNLRNTVEEYEGTVTINSSQYLVFSTQAIAVYSLYKMVPLKDKRFLQISDVANEIVDSPNPISAHAVSELKTTLIKHNVTPYTQVLEVIPSIRIENDGEGVKYGTNNSYNCAIIQIPNNLLIISGVLSYAIDYCIFENYNAEGITPQEKLSNLLVKGNLHTSNSPYEYILGQAGKYLIICYNNNGYNCTQYAPLTEVISNNSEELINTIFERTAIPNYNSPLTWVHDYYIKATTGQPAINSAVSISNHIRVTPGDTLYIRRWSTLTDGDAIIAAYDYNGNYLHDKSVLSDSTTRGNNNYQILPYVVPNGVYTIRFSTYQNKNNNIYTDPLCKIGTTANEEIVSKESLLKKDYSVLKSRAGYYGKSFIHGQWFIASEGAKSLASTVLIPADGFVSMYYSNLYNFSITGYDKDLNIIKSITLGNTFFSINSNDWDANIKYFFIRCTKKDNSDIISYDDTDLTFVYDNKDIVNNSNIPLTIKDYYKTNIIKDALINAHVINDYINDKMAHGSRLVLDEEGNLLTAYYHSLTNENEGQSVSNGVLLAKCNPCNLKESNIVNVLEKGEKVGDFQHSYADSPYDPNIYKMSPTQYRLFLTVKETHHVEVSPDVLNWVDETNCIAYRDFNPQTMELSDTIHKCNIKYKGTSYLMNVANMETILDLEYGPHAEGKSRIGTYIIMTAPFKKYNEELYTYIWSLVAPTIDKQSDGWCGAIIKSSDNGNNWDIVNFCNVPLDWNSHTNWEVGLELVDSKFYILFRNSANHCPMTTYDIATNTWSDVVDLAPLTLPIPNSNRVLLMDPSRPELVYYRNYLYAIQNVKFTYSVTSDDIPTITSNGKQVFRGMMCIWKLDKDLNVIDYKIYFHPFGVSYMSIVLGNGFGYFGFTEDRTAKHQTEENYNKRHISIMPFQIGEFIW